MSEVKLKVVNSQGDVVGYFVNFQIEQLTSMDYEIKGDFVDADQIAKPRIDFNPESLPYFADLGPAANFTHKRLGSGYVQRGRQPVVMSFQGI